MPITLGYIIPGVWSRHDDPELPFKDTELTDRLVELTKTAFKSSDWEFIEKRNGNEEDRYQCICSCNKLSDYYIIKHTPTGMRVGIGSSCIDKFGNEDLTRNTRAAKRNHKCESGNVIADLRTRNGRAGKCDLADCPTCRKVIIDYMFNQSEKFEAKKTGWILWDHEAQCWWCHEEDHHYVQAWLERCLLKRNKLQKCIACKAPIPEHPYKIRCIKCWKRT
jgi:hypothetical protein